MQGDDLEVVGHGDFERVLAPFKAKRYLCRCTLAREQQRLFAAIELAERTLLNMTLFVLLRLCLIFCEKTCKKKEELNELESGKKLQDLDLPCKNDMPPVTCSTNMNDPFNPSGTLKYCSPMPRNDEKGGSCTATIIFAYRSLNHYLNPNLAGPLICPHIVDY